MAAVSHETISPKAGWWSRAACRSADPELFFPVSAAGPSRVETAAAKAVCAGCDVRRECLAFAAHVAARAHRSEEHTSELQSRLHLVCRLLLAKKKQLH